MADRWNLRSILGRVEFADDITEEEIEGLLPLKVKLTEELDKEEEEEFEVETNEVELRQFRTYEFVDLNAKSRYVLEVRTGNSK